MTYKTVLRSLLDVFPQIDLRILKSVAIEYAKDADAAVEFILSDVLPVISEPVVTSYTPDVFHDTEDSFDEHQGNSLYSKAAMSSKEAMSELSQVEKNDNQYGYQSNKTLNVETKRGSYDQNSSGFENASLSRAPCETSASYAFQNSETVTLAGVTKYSENLLDGSKDEHVTVPELCQPHYDGFLETLSVSVPYTVSSLSLNPTSITEVEMKQIKDINKCSDRTQQSGTSKDISNVQGAPAKGGNVVSIEKVSNESTSLDELPLSRKENEKVSIDGKSQVPNYATRLDQIVELDVLESDIIQAESSKDMLTSQFDSVMKMLQEIEHHEDLAKKIEEEVSSAEEEHLKKLENLQWKATNAEKANHEKAREVKGEKFLLETKAREIHNQLFNISDNRDKCHSMIEEVGLILDARLIAAKAREEKALQMKIEKEKMNRIVLNEHEAFVEFLLQESNRIEEEAKENAKLKKFLEDCACIVDTLKENMDFLFKHATTLKGRVDMCAELESSLVPINPSSLAALTSSYEENLPSESVGQSLVSPNPVTIVEEPSNQALKGNADSTNVVQSLQNSTVMSAPRSLSTSSGPSDNSAFAKTVTVSLLDSNFQMTQNSPLGAASTDALVSLEKGNGWSGSSSLVSLSSSDEEATLVGTPVKTAEEPAGQNLETKGSVDNQPLSDDDWEICDESEFLA